MNMSNALFPVEASILSSDAVYSRLLTEYSSKCKISLCRLYYRSIHDTYIVTADEATFFLKVYRYGFRTKEEIMEEIDALIHLKNCGIFATLPIEKNDGSFITEFNTIQGIRYAVLYSSVGIKSFAELNDTALFSEKLGKYISSMHNAWDSFKQLSCRWQLDTEAFIDASMKQIIDFSSIYVFDVAFLKQVAQKTKAKVNALAKRMPEYGICHGDIYSGNIRLDINDNPILFDFDFCGYGWRAYDISIFLSPFNLNPNFSQIEKTERRKEAFIKGYNSYRVLSNEEIISIDLFIPFRRIFNIGSIYIAMANTWGDACAIQGINEDIDTLKKWLDANPIL